MVSLLPPRQKICFCIRIIVPTKNKEHEKTLHFPGPYVADAGQIIAGCGANGRYADIPARHILRDRLIE